MYRYVHELPYPPRKELCDILDADGKWEELGGFYMDYSPTALKLIGQAIYRNQSPTSELLDKFGQTNGTIKQLFLMLDRMGHQRAMRSIYNYVDQKYHYLLHDGVNDTALNVASSLHIPFENKMQPRPSAPDRTRTTAAHDLHGKDFVGSLSPESKFLPDSANMNNFSESRYFPQKLSEFSGASAAQSSTLKTNFKPHRALSPHPVQDKINSNLQEKIRHPYNGDCFNHKDKAIGISNEKKLLNIPPGNGIDCKKKVETAMKLQDEKNDLDIFTDTPVMKIHYKDLARATGSFDRSRVLGSGGFGIVYKGEWKGVPVAIKRLMPKEGTDNALRHQVSVKQSLAEINALNRCRIDNILPLYAVCLDGPEPCLVYQFMINGSLEDRLLCKSNTPPLTWQQRANIVEGMARGLHYLHSLPGKPLVHGDIKSANILLDANMEAKIGDFGLAREGPATQYTHLKVSSVHGTQVYLPPEYIRQKKLSPKVDVYSFGIVLLEIATGQRAFNDKRAKAKLLMYYVADTIADGHKDRLQDTKAGTESQEWFDEMLKMGQKCSSEEKRKRPDMEEVLTGLDEAKERIKIMTSNKQIKEPILPPSLSPLEIQRYYDARRDPTFHPLNPENLPRKPQLPLLDFAKLKFEPPLSAFSSFDPSQIRWPPNDDISVEVVAPPAAYYVDDSSCGATVDSSNYANNSLENMGAQAGPCGTSSSSSSSPSLPLLTELLGIVKDPQNNATSSTNLGPTPAPSGVLSDFNTQGEPLVIRTPKPIASSLAISTDEEDDDDDSR